MAWHEQGQGKRPSFLFKLKLTANVNKAIANVSWDDWQGKSNEGLVQLAEIEQELNGWSCQRRVVVEGTLKPVKTVKPVNASLQRSFWRQRKKNFSAFVSNLTIEGGDAFQIFQLYRQWADAANVFDELTNQWGFAGFSS